MLRILSSITNSRILITCLRMSFFTSFLLFQGLTPSHTGNSLPYDDRGQHNADQRCLSTFLANDNFHGKPSFGMAFLLLDLSYRPGNDGLGGSGGLLSFAGNLDCWCSGLPVFWLAGCLFNIGRSGAFTFLPSLSCRCIRCCSIF